MNPQDNTNPEPGFFEHEVRRLLTPAIALLLGRSVAPHKQAHITIGAHAYDDPSKVKLEFFLDDGVRASRHVPTLIQALEQLPPVDRMEQKVAKLKELQARVAEIEAEIGQQPGYVMLDTHA